MSAVGQQGKVPTQPFWTGNSQTKEQVRNVLKASVARALSPVTHRDFYIDTLEIVARPALSRSDLQRLAKLNGQNTVKAWKWRGGPFCQVLRLQQPKAVTVAALHQAFQWHRIRRADVALDLAVGSAATATRLADFLGTALRQKWHGDRTMTQFRNTYYFSGAWQKRNIVIYGSKPSKVSAAPCAHLELRFYGFEQCRKLGLNQIPDLYSWNAADELVRNCCFAAVVPRLVGKRVRCKATNLWLQRHLAGHQPLGTQASTEAELITRLAACLHVPASQLASGAAQRWCEVPWWKPAEVMADASAAPLVKGLRTPNLF
jgi:hypothetical protein